MIVLFVNFKSSNGIAFIGILEGNYTDFSPDWYTNIGGTLTFTLFLNIFTPHATKLLNAILVISKRVLDRGIMNKLKDENVEDGVNTKKII